MKIRHGWFTGMIVTAAGLAGAYMKGVEWWESLLLIMMLSILVHLAFDNRPDASNIKMARAIEKLDEKLDDNKIRSS